MIKIIELHKQFNGVEVLKGINCQIDKGSIFGLAGRSGSGKSTLLRCINGLENYDSGSISINNRETSKLTEMEFRHYRRKIGIIFQRFSLLKRLTVYENVALPMKCWGYSRQEIDRKVNYLLEVVGLETKINVRPHELSGGQMQRVAIARALTLDSEVLLCDEATSALDPRTTESILELLKKINRELNITMIIVSHQMEVLKKICDKIAILENGKIEFNGSVVEVLTKKPKCFINLLGDNHSNLPKSGVNVEIFLFDEKSDFPIISEIYKNFNIDCRIVGGEFGSSLYNSLVLNFSEDEWNQVRELLDENDINWSCN